MELEKQGYSSRLAQDNLQAEIEVTLHESDAPYNRRVPWVFGSSSCRTMWE